jgi:hypothetical protein
VAVSYGTEDAGAILKGAFIYSPYNQGFVQWLKDTVPGSERAWHKEDKCWYVADAYAGSVVSWLMAEWPNIDWGGYERGKAKRPQAQQSTGGRQQSSGQRSYEQERQRQRGNFGYWWEARDHRGNTTGSGFTGAFTSMPSTHHAKLYVTPEAPPEVIRAAYKALAMLYHPDRGGDGVKMREVNEAFESLQKAGKA